MFKSKVFYVILLIIIAIFLVWQMKAHKTPEPHYQILKNDGTIQIRQYPSLIVAQVEVSGERYSAIKNGFRILADYIFGKNSISQKIQMTAPVLQKKINQGWIVGFIMPDSFTLETLPKPINTAISLIKLPSTKYVVIRFSGMNSKKNLEMHLLQLQEYISTNHLNNVGEPTYAFYNPPWILPFLRRNEIMIELK
jgi:hypothetical protein